MIRKEELTLFPSSAAALRGVTSIPSLATSVELALKV